MNEHSRLGGAAQAEGAKESNPYHETCNLTPNSKIRWGRPKMGEKKRVRNFPHPLFGPKLVNPSW